MQTAYATRLIKRRSPEELQAVREAICEVINLEHPMTLRALFYRLVSRAVIAKLEKEYGKLSRMLCQMREAGLVPWDYVVDNTRGISVVSTWDSIGDALDDISLSYRRDPWKDQEANILIACEKDAIASVLAAEADPFAVPLAVVRGFSSHTFLHDIAMRITYSRKPTYIFYFGDYDPSGLAVEEAFRSTIQHFAPDAEIYFSRLAVTKEQITEYNLMTRPTKLSDSRSRNFKGESVEVDAMPMTTLREFVRRAIESVLNHDVYAETMKVEEKEQEQLRKWVAKYR